MTMEDSMKRIHAFAWLALPLAATAPASAAGKFPGLNLPGAVHSSSTALRDIGAARKLLKTFYRSASDSDTNTPLVSADPTIGEVYDVPGTSVTVTCPAGMKCMIEATVNFSWTIGANSAAAGSVKIDSVALFGDVAAGGSPTSIDTFTSWTYVKQVNAGPHIVQPFVTYVGNTTLFGNSVVIRLYQK